MSVFSGIAIIILKVLPISIKSNYIVWEKSVLFLIKANSYFARARDHRLRPHIDDYGIYKINVILTFDERGRGAAVDGLGWGREAQARTTVDGRRWGRRARAREKGAGAGEVWIGLRCTIWYIICIISHCEFSHKLPVRFTSTSNVFIYNVTYLEDVIFLPYNSTRIWVQRTGTYYTGTSAWIWVNNIIIMP